MPNIANIDISLIVLFILLALGVFSQNNTIILATVLLIILKISPFGEMMLPYVDKYGISFGILILTIGVLAPIASGKLNSETILQSFISPKSLIAILVGLLVAYLGGRGVKLMTNEPQVIAGLLIGTVLGVAFCAAYPLAHSLPLGFYRYFIGKSKWALLYRTLVLLSVHHCVII